MDLMWAVVDLHTSKPGVVQVRAVPFEEDFYVEPGQTTSLYGKVSDKKLFKTRDEAIEAAVDALRHQQQLLESQIRHLHRIQFERVTT